MTRNVGSTTGFRTALRGVGMIIFAAFSSILWLLASHSQAYAASPITPSGLNTQVSAPIDLPSGQAQYNITGGTRPGGGSNLFHSFGDFSVPTNNIANFLNAGSIDLNGNILAPNLPTSNILGRVTGGNVSNIFGTISTTDFGNANLFLMNRAGFLFGPNATVNVGGMVSFTTADYLRLTDAKFNAVPNTAADALLTAMPVAAFGFLGPDAASIAVQGSTLKVAEGQTLSLIGGNRTFEMATETSAGEFVPSGTTAPSGVTIAGGTLVAKSGHIYIASVDSAGEVIASPSGQPAGLNVSSFSKLGLVELSGGTMVDVSTLLDADFNPISDLGNGSVHIRGGQFVMDSATITAFNFGTLPGEQTAVSIQVTGDAQITNGSTIQTVNFDAPGGDISVKAQTLTVSGGSFIQTASLSARNGGNISIDANTISLGNASTIETLTDGSGTGGAINVTLAESLLVDGAIIDSFTFGNGNGGPLNIQADQNVTVINGGKIQTTGGVEGNAGDITIKAGDTITVSGQVDPSDPNTRSMISTAGQVGLMGGPGNIDISAGKFFLQDNAHIESFAFNQPGGNIAIHADDLVSLSGGARVRLEIGTEPGGLVTINAPTITMDGASVRAKTAGAGNAGEIRFEGNVIALSNSEVNSSSVGAGRGGDVTMVATERFNATGQFTDEFGNNSPAGVFSQAFENGNAGNISVTAPTTEITNGARIDSSTYRIGNAGAVTVNTDSLLLTAGGRISSSNSFVVPGVIPTGAGGNVTIKGTNTPAQSVLIDGGGSGIFTDTQGTGAGGNIEVSANTVTLQNGGTLSAKTAGSDTTATGGTITVEAINTVSMTNGASINASSTGTADAGSIDITAANGFTMQNSTITTQAGQGASGGNIEVTTSPEATVWLRDSKISASVADGPGGGGNISIDPQFVILLNSQILAQAAQGQGGRITITAGLFLPDANSIFNADSGSGLNGTVTIQSPNAPASGKIQPLGKTPLQATSLLNQHCASLAGGEFSSFTVAGRDSLPTEPSSWLTSPLALTTLSAGTGIAGRGKGLEGMALGASIVSETALLSLRQIAPAGFLTQAFALDWSASCQS